MAIKMRVNNKRDSVCCECGMPKNKVLDMFDVQIAGQIFTICDECNRELFSKTLKAECYKNGRVKTKEDMAIIRLRGNRKWKENLERELEDYEKIRGL